MTRERGLDLLGTLLRLVLGGVILVAGALKVTNLGQSALAVRAYQLLPYDLAGYVGYALPIIEIVIGLLLVLGLFTRISALLGALLMLAFVIGIASAWARGLSIDCGCFGGGGTIGAEETAYPLELSRDVALLLAGAWLVRRPHTAYALDDRI
ncbi:MAG TPA: DoxX family membrane protein [Dermatophilaceae bacterium]|nr:DoxX family membrane protein [Dermatophilaceae bacterium]HOA02320.1 DoxX family membrane protein [Dermatophilaceae bacterium]HOV01242.1 DoxX family membrane protein [Dermatophilaceae bacterium]HPV78507.1 DoxX family membrane protein [Dermatophilaceae bacterium]HQG09908.1 DoxX family membrane protein [Dermatophilaceae bacterium]